MKEDDTGGIRLLTYEDICHTVCRSRCHKINGQKVIQNKHKMAYRGPKSPYTRKLTTRNNLNDIVIRPDSDLKYLLSPWNKNKKKATLFAVIGVSSTPLLPCWLIWQII